MRVCLVQYSELSVMWQLASEDGKKVFVFFKRLAEVPGREFTEELFFQTLLFSLILLTFAVLCSPMRVCHSPPTCPCIILWGSWHVRSEQLYKTVSAVVLAPGLTLASS